jgi:hypothetical protein
MSLIIEGISDKVSQFQNVTEVNQLKKTHIFNTAESLKQYPIFFVVTFFSEEMLSLPFQSALFKHIFVLHKYVLFHSVYTLR